MSKLHPIYVALDSHQYNRAIKLASALPDSNVLGKALLAHAYSKAGQKYNSLVTLNKLLGESFFELRHEVRFSLEETQVRAQESSTVPKAQPEPAAPKKGKKGKKKPAPPPKQQAPPKSAEPKWDLVDQLDIPQSLPENWSELPPAINAITDETTLGTLSVTLQTLKLPLTAYQLYAWAATADPSEMNLTKTFCLGLCVLASPSKWNSDSHSKIECHVLAHLQAVALQWARSVATQPSESAYPTMLPTAWAAQTALWQLHWLPSDDRRSMILPRLAESMAQRLLEQEGDSSRSAEIGLLSLRTLEQQSKWAEIFQMLEMVPTSSETKDQEGDTPSGFGVALTTHQILTEKAQVLMKLEQYDKAQEIFEALLATSPDDWSCWKGHLECCVKQDQMGVSKSLVEKVVHQQSESKYPLRGPHLMIVELASQVVRQGSEKEPWTSLATAVKDYSQRFAPRVSCAFTDVESYVELLLTGDNPASKEAAEALLEFASTMRNTNVSADQDSEVEDKERQTRLRAFIFAIKLTHKVLSAHEDLQNRWLPNPSDLVKEWKGTLSMGSPKEGEVTQKELKPGDELILLTVQQLLHTSDSNSGAMLACAGLLEAAIEHSPDNAYLKMAAVQIYHQLDAMPHAWELFQSMGLKHIQLDSCIYTILPCLLEGGMYNESIELCNALLRFQASTARDCGDYAGRAMEAGTLTKANEIMVFQRNKMIKSLAVLEAKGIILDSAPLLANVVPRKKLDEDPVLTGALGLHQGIVGGDEDMVRATRMVVEAHNPYAALSLVSWADQGGSMEECETMADNRDFSILFHQILRKIPIISREEMSCHSLHRGYVHGLLIRASLCLEATKGPKKGKVVKASDLLAKRTKSLLDCATATLAFADKQELGSAGDVLLRTTLDLVHVLSMLSSGMPQIDNDSLEQREQRACDVLRNEAAARVKVATEQLSAASTKMVSATLPTYIVPMFTMFRMCANVCNLFGWGKRKRNTKRCAGAIADFAVEFRVLVDNLLKGVKSLPASESDIQAHDMKEEYKNLIDSSRAKSTEEVVVQAQFRTRARVEPILEEMRDFLNSFDIEEK